MWTDLSTVLSQYTRVTDRQTDRQTDGQTDRQTEFSSQYRVCITCSAVKIIELGLTIPDKSAAISGTQWYNSGITIGM